MSRNFFIYHVHASFSMISIISLFSLPEYIIVPGSVTDSQLINAAQHFQDNRPPIWSWSNERGAALVKMAELSSTITERTQENIMLENIRKSHPRTIQPIVIELNKEVGVKTIAASFSKLASLCSPGIFCLNYILK